MTEETLLDASLDVVLRRQQLDWQVCLRIAASVASALAQLHATQRIYREVRPGLILVADDLAHATLVPDRPDAPATGNEWAYLSPEQTGRMNWPIDHRTDLYSLGVTLYRMLTGTLPFQANDPLEWVHAHIARIPHPPADVMTDVPGIVSDMVMKLLAKAPEERYQSAAALQSDLDHCLTEWQDTGRVDPFLLDSSDLIGRFQIPRILYGREAEAAELLRAFDRVAGTVEPTWVLVSGPAGIGKSVLIDQLRRPIVERQGYFISGKFDQYGHDIPYATMVQAFRELVQQILTESDARIATWRQQFHAALNSNGRLILDIIPQVELIIGPQPEVPELPPLQAQHRFQQVFRQFLGVVASEQHPLVLFLDDLQWADSASLALLQHLLTRPQGPCLMLVGAYRDHEVSPSHPFMLAAATIRNSITPLEIHLGTLDEAGLCRLLIDTLHCVMEDARPLAGLVRRKTEGNPFFVIQFLQLLHRDGLFVFNRQRGWQWDLERIQEADITDNVVDLMAAEIGRLPPETQQALKLAACVGSRFDLADLAQFADGTPAQQLMQQLQPALDKGLLLRVRGQRETQACRWSHDRTQQAAYSLIPAEEVARLHLSIGRRLREATPAPRQAERLFEIVNHYNAGAALIDSEAERIGAADLNLAAGQRAKASMAYASALNYFLAGIALLGPDWERCYEIGFPLHLERASCALLNGNADTADQESLALLAKTRSKLDKTAIYRLRQQIHLFKGEIVEAVADEINNMAVYGIELPSHPTREDLVAACDRVRRLLGDRPIEAIVDLPASTDPEQSAVMSLLPISTSINKELGTLELATMVALAIEHGNSDACILWYSMYANGVLAAEFDAYQDAHRFATAAYALTEKRGVLAQKAATGYCAGATAFWTEPIDDAIHYYEVAIDTAIEIGDHLIGGYSGDSMVLTMLARGDILARVEETLQGILAFARHAHLRDWVDILTVIGQFIKNLQGRTRDCHTFSDAHFDQAGFETTLTGNRWGRVGYIYWIMKLHASFLFGDYAQAKLAADHARSAISYTGAFAENRDFHLYRALLLAALFDNGTAAQQQEWLTALAEHQRKIGCWAAANPGTFAHIDALVAAEIARISDRPGKAAQLYETSLRHAREGKFIQDEALAYELAAQFHHARGFAAFGDLYLWQARACYARWGADGKVRQLEERYPHVADTPLHDAGFGVTQIDALSLAKASQAISGQIVLDDLLDTLMRIVMENAGAQQGCLLLETDGELTLAARANIQGQGWSVDLTRGQASTAAGLPESMLNYVRRSKEPVVLGDAGTAHPFSADPCLLQLQPKSVLCLPILRQAKLIGLLYLENRLVAHAFTPGRLAVLEQLASQAAISLQNAWLYTELQQENKERKRVEAALREREARIRRLVESNIIGILFWDIDGRILEANDAFLHMIGFTRQDWIAIDGLRWNDLTPEEYRAKDNQVLQELLATGRCTNYETERLHKDGTRVPVLIASVLLEGSRHQGVAFVHDLTERKQGEAEREARVVAEAANEAKSAFVASMNHELRTPLNAILGFSRLIKDMPTLPDEARQDLGIIQRSGEHLLTLINEVLDWSKIESGQATLNEADFNMVRLLADVDAMFAPRMKEKKLAFDIAVAPTMPQQVRSDPTKLRQVLINLLENALKFTETGSVRVQVECTTATNHAGDCRFLFAVTDTGYGIAASEINSLFGAFVQTEAGRQARQGTGLGLAISRNFVRLMGGDMHVESRPGEGTTFRFDIGVSLVSAVEVPATPPVLRRHVVGLAPGQPSWRILVVDDHAPSRQLLVRQLSLTGFEVEQACNGQEAVELARSWRPHLIWMDMRMPVMGGREATRRIRESEWGGDVIIIALSASCLGADPARLIVDGCNDFMLKPFQEAELFNMLQKYLPVQFVFAEETEPGQPAARNLTPALLAALPPALVAPLDAALAALEVQAVERALAEIEAFDADTARALAALVGDYQYDRVQEMIRTARGGQSN